MSCGNVRPASLSTSAKSCIVSPLASILTEPLSVFLCCLNSTELSTSGSALTIPYASLIASLIKGPVIGCFSLPVYLWGTSTPFLLSIILLGSTFPCGDLLRISLLVFCSRPWMCFQILTSAPLISL